MTIDVEENTVPEAIARATTLGIVLLALCPGTLDVDDLEETARTKAPNELIGQACVRRRLVTVEDVELAVTFHERMRKSASADECMSIFREVERLGAERQQVVVDAFDGFYPPTGVHEVPT